MKTLISAALLAAAPFALSPVGAQAPEPQVGAVADPCKHVDPMPQPVADYFAAVLKARATKAAAPTPTPEQLTLYKNWQVRVRQQDFAQLCKYAADNAALPPATAHRVIYYGDSITELWGLNDPAFFTDDVINLGISGQTTAQMLLRFRADVIALKPKVIHIIAGTNDVAGNTGPSSVDRIMDNITTMVELAKLHGITVVLGSELPCVQFGFQPQLKPAPILAELNVRLRKLAADQKLTFVDYFAPLADKDGAFDKRYSDDGLHPTAAGYAVMAPLAKATVAKALKK